MSNWKEYRLGDIITIKSGFAYKGSMIGSGENILLGMGCVSFLERFLVSGARIYGGDCADRYCANTGDIVLATRQQSDNLPILGMPAIVPKCLSGKKIIVGANLYLVDNQSDFSNEYIYWLLKTPQYVNHIRSCQTGTTVRMITKSNIEEFRFAAPEYEEREEIAHVLKTLDDKIDINKSINKNLEEQAQTLFKSWFIDYEPFKKDGFEKSEAGLIPKGWRVGCYNDIIKETISGDWGKETSEGNYTHKVACIRGCDFQDIKNGLRGKTPERYILEKNYQNKHFCDKDMLVEISGGTATVSTGRVCPVSQLLIDKFDGNIVCTNFCRVVRPIAGYGAFLYYSWLYKYNNKVMFGYENGTSGIKNFRIKDFTALEPVVIPPKEVISQFQHLVDTILMQMQTYGTQNQCLAELRDTLLPCLMSGELKVNDIENSL